MMQKAKEFKVKSCLRYDRHRRGKRIAWMLAFGLLFLAAAVLFSLSIWYQLTFDMEFAELLYTLMAPVGGTGQSTLTQILSACLPPVLLLMILYAVGAVLLFGEGKIRRILRRICAWLCIVALLASVTYTTFAFRIPRYISQRLGYTTVYEDHYVDPDTVRIYNTDGQKKNLIYIYLESMETTYLSEELGGVQQMNNYLPNLSALAQEPDNVSFSDSDLLGGFHSISGTAWTMGALMSTTSGVPFSKEVFGDSTGNSQGNYGNFANRLTTLGDILEKEGYRQEFLCGSDSGFAGRDAYFTQHGNYEIYDYFSAIRDGYIDEDYYVWWGLEDSILYDIAKDEVTELAAGDQPFNFTMLTVDTHHVGGYRCSLCQNAYSTGLENIVSCADRQVADFLDWCREQDFYQDTVIIVTGDHPRMDRQLVDGVDFYDRTIYNCFINAEADTDHTAWRTFTSMDIFPTVLAAMGYTIEGDRLGLGVNLFSSLPTLSEKFGYEWLDDELCKYSPYYLLHFI